MSETTNKVKSISIRLLILLATFILSLFLFFLIVNEIVLENEQQFDLKVFSILDNLESDNTKNLMLFFTFFGSTKFLLPAYILLGLYYMFLQKNRTHSLNISAIGLGSAGLLHLAKNIFRRQRPLDPLIDKVSGFSFPSGHSFSSFTLGGILIYSIWQSELLLVYKWLLSIFIFLFASATALSRVYLHVHYASDVIAGLLLSIIWLSISIFFLERIAKSRKTNIEVQVESNDK